MGCQALRRVERGADDVLFAWNIFAFERRRVMQQAKPDLLGERLASRELTEGDSGARGLIDVGRTDAASGGSERGGTARPFARAIARSMIRKHHVRAIGNLDPGNVDADRG